MPANTTFSSIYIPHTNLKNIYTVYHKLTTYDIQNVCKESYDASYFTKRKILLYSLPAYMSDDGLMMNSNEPQQVAIHLLLFTFYYITILRW